MKILLIGSGAREHALARKIMESSSTVSLLCYGSSINPGIAPLVSHYIPGEMSDIMGMVQCAQNHEVDMVVVGPEAPLASGIADELHKHGIACIGPSSDLAQIETSKAFGRDFVQAIAAQYVPRYRQFQAQDPQALEFLESLGQDFVLKADGLCGGKGVKISGEQLHSHQQALDDPICQEPFVIEEKCTGVEFSLISFCDGAHAKHMPIIHDHKRLLDDDQGPNTGGMGTISDHDHHLPFIDPDMIQQAQALNELVMKSLSEKCAKPYCGFLYGGFMQSTKGLKLIEYNARLGDPEGINLLALLETDIVAIFEAMIAGRLDQQEVVFKTQASVCKYIVPSSYPGALDCDPLMDISAIERPERLYFGSIDMQGDQLRMKGSRAIAVLATGDTLCEAALRAEETCELVQGSVYYRKDIGSESLLQKRAETLITKVTT